jgi:hypothetical protein
MTNFEDNKNQIEFEEGKFGPMFEPCYAYLFTDLLDYLHINWAAKYLDCLPGKSNSMPVVVIQYTGIVTEYLNKGWKKSIRGNKENRFKIYKPREILLEEKALPYQRAYKKEEDEASTEDSGSEDSW